MTALLIIEGVAIVLLAILVVGLLRTNADILRALHELGAGEPGSPSSRSRRHLPAPDRQGDVSDVSGVSLTGSALHIGVNGAPHATLLAFLSTGCSACLGLWEGLNSGEAAGASDEEDWKSVV